MDEISKNILDTIQIGALATVNPDGSPLITPLHFARFGEKIIWITSKDSQHSKNHANGEPIEFVVWNEQKQAVYLKATASEIGESELVAAEKYYQEKLGDFRPQVKNPAFYKAPIGKPDDNFPDGTWKHFTS